MSSVLIKNIQVADPTSAYNGKNVDIFIEKGIVKQIGKSLSVQAKDIIQGKGKFIAPGWISLMTDFAEPGFEHRETIDTGLQAAANGGFTQVIVLPNTQPTMATKSVVAFVQQKAKGHPVGIHVLGAVSQNIEGKNLAEMMEMYHSGAIAFSDGWKPIQNAGLMQKALEYVKAFEGTVVQIPVLAELSDGLMNEGPNSVQFGMPGIPVIAETLMVHRDIELARYTQSKLHLSGISTAESLNLIKKAKKDGVQVTCSVAPYHLLYTDDILATYDSLYKVNPPLRTEKDRKALLKGLEEGTIDAIATHHKPQDWDAKVKEFEYTQSGMATLESCWPMLVKAAPNVSAERWAALLSNNIAGIFGLPIHSIEEGTAARYTIFDFTTEWTLTTGNKATMAYNTPLLNEPVKGKAVIL
ncbi:dihydroorotase [Taibaiella sp. KBW10]|uniref:dihydroorotase n=1 Tax=Taibaiella sp. KBW10 TaxID=2153357 RepID=UPI000F5B0211|nr:dihydroorotase [Taibaiella sp. KBW10]RQO32482.1 dihydroorotase [Taibaiella sp. KBW10]